MNKYLLDTNSVIYALKQGYVFPDGEYFISIITEIELLSFPSLTDKDVENIRCALTNFKIIELTSIVKTETIKIRKKTKLKLPDSIIVATAIINEAILVTSDKKILNLTQVASKELFDLDVN